MYCVDKSQDAISSYGATSIEGQQAEEAWDDVDSDAMRNRFHSFTKVSSSHSPARNAGFPKEIDI